MFGYCRFGQCWRRWAGEWPCRRDPAFDLWPTSWPTCRASECIQRVHGRWPDSRRRPETRAQVWWTRQVTEHDGSTLEPTSEYIRRIPCYLFTPSFLFWLFIIDLRTVDSLNHALTCANAVMFLALFVCLSVSLSRVVLGRLSMNFCCRPRDNSL